MNIIISYLVFIFGLIVGSFLNCALHRFFKKEDFVIKRSYCPHCRHTLAWHDLIPVLSFLLLKGKCRYCGRSISYQYPLVEISTGFIFAFVFRYKASVLLSGNLIFGIIDIIFWLAMAAVLIFIFIYDAKHYIIPDKIIFPSISAAVVWRLAGYMAGNVFNREALFKSFASAFFAALFFLAIVIISKGKGMGMGDVKLAFLMGLILGFPGVLAALAAGFFLGAVTGIILIAAGKKGLKSEVPFAPFLVAGTFLALFFSADIIDFYFNFVI